MDILVKDSDWDVRIAEYILQLVDDKGHKVRKAIAEMEEKC